MPCTCRGVLAALVLAALLIVAVEVGADEHLRVELLLERVPPLDCTHLLLVRKPVACADDQACAELVRNLTAGQQRTRAGRGQTRVHAGLWARTGHPAQLRRQRPIG